MKGKRSICKECNYDPQLGCEIAERKYGDYVPVIKKTIKPGPGEKQCIGCDGIFPDKEFVTKAGKNSPSCGKCRLAWVRSQK